MSIKETMDSLRQRRIDRAVSFKTTLARYERDPKTASSTRESHEGLKEELQDFTRRLDQVPPEFRQPLQRLMAEQLHSVVLQMNVLVGEVLQDECDPLSTILGLREAVDRTLAESLGVAK